MLLNSKLHIFQIIFNFEEKDKFVVVIFIMNKNYFEFTLGKKIPKEVIEGKMKTKNRLAIRGVLFFQNKLLMIQTSKGDYKFPGGGQEENESDFETLNREYQEETGFSNLIKNATQIELIGKAFTQNFDTEDENKFFVMESRYYLIKILDEEFSKIKNVGQKLDDYEKDLNFKYEFVSVKAAFENNKALLKNADKANINFWVERETLVLEKLLSFG